MQVDSLSGLSQKGLLLLLSFTDDVALFLLSRLGFHWAWLQWLSTVLLAATLIYWVTADTPRLPPPCPVKCHGHHASSHHVNSH